MSSAAVVIGDLRVLFSNILYETHCQQCEELLPLKALFLLAEKISSLDLVCTRTKPWLMTTGAWSVLMCTMPTH